MFVSAGGALVSREGHLRTPSRESQPGFSAWRWRGAGTGRKGSLASTQPTAVGPETQGRGERKVQGIWIGVLTENDMKLHRT